jgi:hypothetical protein
MYKIISAAVICIAFVTACNNSGDKKENKSDSSMSNMGNDTMHHMPAAGTDIPALPAIPEGAKVFFKNLKNDQTISMPFKVEMGTEVMKVDTANSPLAVGSGHHHLLIDAEDSLAAGTVVPKDSTHIHFGKGQTEYELKSLSPGKHKLTLQMADAIHRSYGGKLSATISVNVKK